MEYIIWSIVGILSGICAALGIGGGFVLLLYLTAIASANQLEAQLMNLIFFIPIGVIALILHIKHKLVEKKIAVPTAISGCIGAVGGVILATYLEPDLISKLFAVFILIVGFFQVFGGSKKKNDK